MFKIKHNIILSIIFFIYFNKIQICRVAFLVIRKNMNIFLQNIFKYFPSVIRKILKRIDAYLL